MIFRRALLKEIHLLPVIMSLVFGMLISQPVSAVETVEFDKLMQSATESGSVRVIVTLQQPTLPERASMSPQDFDAVLKGKVATAQAAVLDKLPANALVGTARRYDFTPQFAATVTPAGLAALARNPRVTAIQEDRLERPSLEQSVPYIFPNNDTSPYTGSGQVVAVLDTGSDKTHPFLSGKVVSEACYSTNSTDPTYPSTSACPGGASSSTASGSGLPCDLGFDPDCAHGTHVAGIAAGFQSNSLHGVAKNGGIIAVQVFSYFPTACSGSPCVASWNSDTLAALNRVYALRNTFDIAAANMSLGASGPINTACDGDARKAPIDLLKGVGIATVISSGNDGFTTGIGTPACISTAIAVGATGNANNTRASFSNVGALLDLYAPGVSINSSIPPSGGFDSWDGTSMAAPHVAGAWAVMKHAKPTATVDEIETAFKSTGVNVTSASVTRKRIDIDQALAVLLGDPPPYDDTLLTSFLPAILAAVKAGKPPGTNPRWGVLNNVCCTTSSATYTATTGSQSKSSTLASCSSEPTFNGYVYSTPGIHSFSHLLSAGLCGDFSSSGSLGFQGGKEYLLVLELLDGVPTVVVYFGDIPSSLINPLVNGLSGDHQLTGFTRIQSIPMSVKQDADGQSNFQGSLLPRTLR